jgi:hypothetical protein
MHDDPLKKVRSHKGMQQKGKSERFGKIAPIRPGPNGKQRSLFGIRAASNTSFCS